MRRTALLALALLLPLGCGGKDPVRALAPCTGPVTLAVSGGRTPTITWTPACSVQQLVVYQPLIEPGEVWRIASTAGIGPGVRYGRVPAGASQPTPARALASGEEAAVEVLRFGTGQPGVLGGVSFTP